MVKPANRRTLSRIEGDAELRVSNVNTGARPKQERTRPLCRPAAAGSTAPPHPDQPLPLLVRPERRPRRRPPARAGRRLRRPAQGDRPAGGAVEHGGPGRGADDRAAAERGRADAAGAGGAGPRPSAGGPSGHDSTGAHRQPAKHGGTGEAGPDSVVRVQPGTCAVEQKAA
jgi:hypothetical protein